MKKMHVDTLSVPQTVLSRDHHGLAKPVPVARVAQVHTGFAQLYYFVSKYEVYRIHYKSCYMSESAF